MEACYFSVAVAAERLMVSKETIRSYIAKGALRATRLPGGYYRIPGAELDRFMQPAQK